MDRETVIDQLRKLFPEREIFRSRIDEKDIIIREKVGSSRFQTPNGNIEIPITAQENIHFLDAVIKYFPNSFTIKF